MIQHKSRIVAFVIATFLFAGVAPAVAAAPATTTPLATVGSLTGEYVPGELVVGFGSSSSNDQIRAALDKSQVTLEQDLTVPRTKLVKFAADESPASAMDRLRRQPGVKFVEPNYIYHLDATPNDPSYPNLWALNNTGQSVLGVSGTPDADIDAPEAWDITTGNNVTVAVVDTGIDYNHPDLAGNLWTNPGETGTDALGHDRRTNGIDDDNDGFIDDWHGWDFVNNDNDPRDQDMNVGHGTHVAGIIGARGNNGAASTGINWNASLVGLRVFDSTGSATNTAVTAAFNYAGDRGIRVVNFSGGGSSKSDLMQAAIDNHPNTLYVVAAGNSGLNLDAPGNDDYPCEFPSINLICVAASTQDDTLASFSNYGANSVDIAAPGVNISSLAPATNIVYSETFNTDPFASRWIKGSNAGTNTWHAEPAYSPLVGQAPSLTDGSPLGADYAANSDTYVQTANAISLAGQTGCSAMFTMYLDVQTTGDRFRVWTRPDTAFDNTNYLQNQNWAGTGFVDDVIDLTALNGGPLNLRFGLFSDASTPTGFDGVYIDNLDVRCVGNSYSPGGSSEVSALSGTSFSSPLVAGAAALVLSRNAALTTTQLRNLILTTGDVKPAFQSGVTGSGMRLNLFGAVNAATPTDTTAPTITITTPPDGANYNVGQSVNATYSCNDTGGSGLATCNGTVANGTPIDTTTPGARTFTVNATDNAGNPATSTHNYTVSAAPPTDTTAPTITITTPPDGANYNVGQSVNATYSCNDTGGSGLATCNGTVANGTPIDTTTPGARTFTVNATDNAGNPATSTHNYTVSAAPPTDSASFVPLSPTRLLDTRGNGTPRAGDTTNLVVTGRGGVPSDGVTAVLVNLTATNTAADGYLTTWPKGETRPNASSLNFAAGQTVANLAVAKVGADGSISIWNSNDSPAMGAADVIVDVVGYFPASAPMGALTPARVVDTRSTGKLTAGATLDLPLLGRGGVPSTGVGAVIVNLTVTGTQAAGYLTTWPTGEARPNASSLNFAAGQTVANLVVAKVGANGSISIWNSNDSPAMTSVDVVVDVVGWLPANAGFGSLTPARILDTRTPSPLSAGATIDLAVLGRGGVPGSGVGAVVLNLTVTGTQAAGYLTTWPTGEARPNASSLNFAAGQTVANLVVAKVGANGSISIWNSNDSPAMASTNVVVDVVGWFAA